MTSLIKIHDIREVYIISSGWLVKANHPKCHYFKVDFNGNYESIIDEGVAREQLRTYFDIANICWIVCERGGELWRDKPAVKSPKTIRDYTALLKSIDNKIPDKNRRGDWFACCCRNLGWCFQSQNLEDQRFYPVIHLLPEKAIKILETAYNSKNGNSEIIIANVLSWEHTIIESPIKLQSVCFSEDGCTILAWGYDDCFVIDNPLIR